ncbi:hypothetical protein CERZMDRAFT_90003, partial [Cercospora zeae-maydis SCOH1-5]
MGAKQCRFGSEGWGAIDFCNGGAGQPPFHGPRRWCHVATGALAEFELPHISIKGCLLSPDARMWSEGSVACADRRVRRAGGCDLLAPVLAISVQPR